MGRNQTKYVNDFQKHITLKSCEFKQMCENYGIKAKPTTSHNPQANAIIERVHKVVSNMLRSFDLEQENLEEDNPFEYFLQSTAWAIRSTYHTTLTGNTLSVSVWQRYDSQHCIQSKLELNAKEKTGHN